MAMGSLLSMHDCTSGCIILLATLVVNPVVLLQHYHGNARNNQSDLY